VYEQLGEQIPKIKVENGLLSLLGCCQY